MEPLKPQIFSPVRISFEKGLGQKFRQAPGTGVMLALFDDKELVKARDENTYPLVVRTETTPKKSSGDDDEQAQLSEPIGGPLPSSVHSQATHAVIERKDDDNYLVRVVKQIIWVDGLSYELQEIYGIENSQGGSSYDGNDSGKECVICMSEPRDTTVLPCRHMVRLSPFHRNCLQRNRIGGHLHIYIYVCMYTYIYICISEENIILCSMFAMAECVGHCCAGILKR